MLAPLLALLMASTEVTNPVLPLVQTQEQKQVPKPHPDVQKLIDAAMSQQTPHIDRITALNKALALSRDLKDTAGEADTLFWFGRAYALVLENKKSIEFFEQALPLLRQVGNVRREAITLTGLGLMWSRLGDNFKALQFYKQALPLSKEAGDGVGEVSTINNIGLAWTRLGDFRKALEFYEMSFSKSRSIGDLQGENVSLVGLGWVWSNLGEKRRALDFYAKSLPISEKLNDISLKVAALNNMALLWNDLGDAKAAIPLFEGVLLIVRQVNDERREAGTLSNIGLAWWSMGERQRALSYYNEALPIWRRLDDLEGEATTLNNLGSLQSDLGQKEKALVLFEQALVLAHRQNDVASAAVFLNNIAGTQRSLGEFRVALDRYLEALMLVQRSGERTLEAEILNGTAATWSSLESPAMAICWSKLSVNTTQALRQGATGISIDADRSLLSKFSSFYESLSSALQSQGRIAEALQVQELQEASRIKDFAYRGTAEQEMFSKRLSLTKLEKRWMDEYENAARPLGELGKQRDELARIRERLPEQDRALEAVEAKLKVAEENFRKTIEAMTSAFQKSSEDDNRLVDLAKDRDLTLLARSLSEKTGRKVGCFATLVGEKSTSVMFIGPDAKVVTRTVEMSRADLSKAVTEALTDLNNPKRQPYATSKKLYDLILKPFESQLNGLDCLMFNLNGPLRYVPAAALWDGQRYLAERFQVTNFSIAVWESLAKDPPKTWGAAFFGLTQKVPGFAQLPGVKAEVESSAPLFKSAPRLNAAFSRSALEAVLKSKKSNLLHFGTHFVLDPASSEATFMVLGDGSKWRPTEMEKNKTLSFDGVDLLVAGACRTGVPTGDDASIEGFGAYCQVKGARAVLSTLWEVNDSSTSAWMKTFYRLLASGTGKGEAYHRAQLAMITGESASTLKLPRMGTRAGSASAASGSAGTPFKVDPKRPLAHPFYWAPFTLSGNWR